MAGPICVSCLYFSFVGLEKACRHPAQPWWMKNGVAKCPNFSPYDLKQTPGKERTVPQKVGMEEFYQRAGRVPPAKKDQGEPKP